MTAKALGAALQRDLSFDPPSRRVHPDGLERAKALGEKGLCIFCETKLPAHDGPGRPRIICEKRGCKRAYWNAAHRDRYRCLAATYQLTRAFRGIAEHIQKLEEAA